MQLEKDSIKNTFPFQVPEPRKMTPLDQILTMVWLADNHDLMKLRKKQGLIEKQFEIARFNRLPIKTIDNLMMMQNNLSAAVAYQKNFDIWENFIKV
ncbi:MAG: hypothetical protein J7L15_00920 [Clostridiales bacterium]|nr:hypothetical protein [Clostridiales bacterium]